MEIISQTEYQQLFEGKYKVLEKDGFGIKIVETSNRKIIKFFRLKSFFSSALFIPYAVRFKNNAERLKALKIPSVTVEKIAYCRQEKRYIVIYPKLEGVPLRYFFGEAYDSNLLIQLAGFIADLHNKGVYFRSLHFGNIIFMDNKKFGLIDIADMRILKKALDPRLCVRNFKHLLRYKDEYALIKQLGMDQFISEYLLAGGMDRDWVAQFHKFFGQLDLSS